MAPATGRGLWQGIAQAAAPRPGRTHPSRHAKRSRLLATFKVRQWQRAPGGSNRSSHLTAPPTCRDPKLGYNSGMGDKEIWEFRAKFIKGVEKRLKASAVKDLECLFRRWGHKGEGDWKVEVQSILEPKLRICAGYWFKDSMLRLEGVRLYTTEPAKINERYQHIADPKLSPRLIIKSEILEKGLQEIPGQPEVFVSQALALRDRVTTVVRMLSEGKS
jgi:hypothetical protein